MAVRDNSRMNGIVTDSLCIREAELDNFRTDRSLVKYEEKVKAGNFSEFTWNDWKKYFISKAKESGVRYFAGDSRKEKSILESLMGNFTANSIKEMIDFIWECDHKLVKNKETIGIFILSKGWLQSVYPLSQKYKEEGDISGRKPREWKEGKRSETSPAKKKSRISIGGK